MDLHADVIDSVIVNVGVRRPRRSRSVARVVSTCQAKLS